ncbi:hypothetical protein [Peptoclostridium sp.]|uniref:hypothetical protein n=1 Tax=Peptoclostridium sp. TaxID=1904860 RepID=UPI002ED09674
MIYNNIKKAKFISRPNRFIANIEIDGKLELCHVKNTGRCKELLTQGAEINVQECDSSNRKTKYDLISVYKGERLINMDSQAPNKVFHEFLSMLGREYLHPLRWGMNRLMFLSCVFCVCSRVYI